MASLFHRPAPHKLYVYVIYVEAVMAKTHKVIWELLGINFRMWV